MEFPASVQRVLQTARKLGLEITIHEMSQTTRTAEEAAETCRCEVGQIVKSLVFQGKDSGKPYLLLVSGRNRVNEKGMARYLGEKLTRPDARQVRDWTSFAIGGIPPFGHSTPLATYIDRDLLEYEIVWAAAGTPFAVFPVEPEKLASALQADIIDVT